jgi:hypothetical protein
MGNFIPRSLTPFERYPNELAPNRVRLGQLHDHHTTLSTRFIGAGGGTLWPTDILIFGVALRSFHLVEGFIQAFDSWNVTVAVPIIRMQIDSLVRIAYVAQAPDCDELATALMRGEQLRKMKTYDDPTRNAYDGELVERAGRIYSWLPPVYDKSNEWVHLSDRLIFNATQPGADPDERSIVMRIPFPIERLPVSFLDEILGAMLETTRALFGWFELWEEHKDQIGDDS